MNMSGWLVRKIEGKGDKRWKRVVVRAVPQGEGGVELDRDGEGMPLPKQYRLGLEKKGEEWNHASRARNNFGMNMRGLSGGDGMGMGYDPSKLTMGERGQLVDRTVELVVGGQKESHSRRCVVHDNVFETSGKVL